MAVSWRTPVRPSALEPLPQTSAALPATGPFLQRQMRPQRLLQTLHRRTSAPKWLQASPPWRRSSMATKNGKRSGESLKLRPPFLSIRTSCDPASPARTPSLIAFRRSSAAASWIASGSVSGAVFFLSVPRPSVPTRQPSLPTRRSSSPAPRSWRTSCAHRGWQNRGYGRSPNCRHAPSAELFAIWKTCSLCAMIDA